MLPSPNVLYHTYPDLHDVMKYIGMEYQVIHECPNDHITYYGEDAFKEECPNSQISRYQIDQAIKKGFCKVEITL